MDSEIIEITTKAQDQMRQILTSSELEKDGIRIGVVGGGCSGLSYKIDFATKTDNDRVLPYEGFKVYIDPKSSIYLSGVIVDFSDGLQGKGFVFKNPNASNTCGCGESFSV